MLFTMMQVRNVHMMHMSLFRDATFMMQMSHARVQMQSLSMMVPAHIFNRDANVSLQRWRCKNLVVQMSSNGYVMMQMLLVGMSWCKCTLVGMPWCKCPFVGMPWCKCPLVGMSWCKYKLFKNFLYFQNEASSVPETKIFSKLDLLFMKSHLPFYGLINIVFFKGSLWIGINEK